MKTNITKYIKKYVIAKSDVPRCQRDNLENRLYLVGSFDKNKSLYCYDIVTVI